jgi:hypothetical protein
MAAVVLPAPRRAAASPFLRGDSNSDAVVNLSDAVFTLGALFAGGRSPACPDAADANDDGAIDIADPIATLSFLFTGAAPLPPPAGAPGDDPTPDDLSCAAAFVDFELNCGPTHVALVHEAVVRSQEEYEDLLATLSGGAPGDCKAPTIDFSAWTLLGNVACASGCSRDYAKEVERDDDARSVTFRVIVTEHGACEPYPCVNQWVLVPAVPESYEVRFEVAIARA